MKYLILCVLVLSLLLVSGCGGYGRTLNVSEIEKHQHKCSNNGGVKAYGISPLDRGLLEVIRVSCKDGAVFFMP